MSTPERQPPRGSTAAPVIGLAGATVLLLAGGWLMFAPFAFGYQPSGADWVDATTTDFFTGLGVAVAAALSGAALAAQLVGRLRAPVADEPASADVRDEAPADAGPAGAAEPREEPTPETAAAVAEPGARTASAETSEVATVLAPLVEALMHDLSESGRARGERGTHESSTTATRNGSYEPTKGGDRQ